MADWKERLRQSRQESEQQNKADQDSENLIYQRLFRYLDKFNIRELLDDVKNEVWQAGDIRRAYGNNGTGGKCAVLQLYHIYEDVEEKYVGTTRRGTLGEDFSSYTGTGYYEKVNKNVFLAIGAVSIPYDYNPEPHNYSGSLIKAGDYMYLAFPVPGYNKLDEWGFDGNRNAGTEYISLAFKDEKILEFVKDGLLKRVGKGFRNWLPLNLQAEGKKNIEKYRSQGLLRNG